VEGRTVDIVHELIARASPEEVFQVLTEAVHLASWYSDRAQIEARIGSVAEFSFDRGAIRVEIIELEPEQKIVWKVLQGMPGWEETDEIIWTLKPNPFGTGTMIHFRHTGWPSMEDAYPSVNFKWGWFIARMKSYVETRAASQTFA
jgi:uncharacterized protein YndB with AHSA1/START domain